MYIAQTHSKEQVLFIEIGVTDKLANSERSEAQKSMTTAPPGPFLKAIENSLCLLNESSRRVAAHCSQRCKSFTGLYLQVCIFKAFLILLVPYY